VSDPVQPSQAADEQVPVWNPHGELVTIAKGDLARATQYEQGYRPASAEEVSQHEAEKQSKGRTYAHLRQEGWSPVTAGTAAAFFPGGALGAAQQATLSGFTGGLGNVGEAKLAGLVLGDKYEASVKKAIQNMQLAHPDIWTAGEVGGMALGALTGSAAGGGALGAASKAIPSVGIGAVGEGVGGLVARQTAELAAKGALGRTAASALEYGARGAVENALYGGVSELSEQMLGDHELNAEKIIAHAAEQGVYGAVFGAGLGAAGSLAKTGVRSLKGLAGENASVVRAAADEQAWRSLNAPKSVAKEAEARFPGGARGLGAVANEHGIVEAAASGPEAALAKANEAVETVGKKIGEIHAASPATISSDAMLADFDKQLSKLEKSGFHQDTLRGLRQAKVEFATAIGALDHEALARGEMAFLDRPVPVQEAITQRKFLDQRVYQEVRALDPNMRVGLLREFRGDLQGQIVKAIDEAGAKAGTPELGAQLKKLSRDYQGLSLIEDGLESAVAGKQTQQLFGLGDKVIGVAGAHAGAVAGGFIGGAPGAFVGGQLGGAGGAIVNKVVRERGNAYAAKLLYKLADYAEAQKAITAVDQQVAKSARGMLADHVKGTTASVVRSNVEPEAAKRNKTPSVRERYNNAVKANAQMQADASGMLDRLTQHPVEHLPKTSAAVTTGLLRSAAYVAAQQPPSHAQMTLGTTPRASVDDVTASAYLRTHATATDPMSALKDFERGHVTPEAVQTLRVVSPKLFEQLQMQALTVIGERMEAGKPVSFQARLKMGLLLGIETDPALNKKLYNVLQGSLAAEPEDEGPKPRKQPVKLDAKPQGLDRLET